MAIFKCKMCGGDLSFQPGNSTGICDYCGAEQTLTKVVDENLQGLFNRANTLRMKAEFDKAAEIYEKILQASGTEAEAYWGLILCKYGIEYVEDPVTYKRVPTCHRASYDAVTADDDYKMALQYADVSQRMIYETEAKQIDEIQKGIIALAQKEDPYDVFICYKETDENGQRTQDSVLANDIYYQLTQEGFKVFYAAITLEDKLGQEYEPYIFSALNSAKVMLVLGTKPEYFSAVWVKNEWSRFLKLMKKDRAKMMIPCYRDMDAYELPQEFAHLQAQNMEKIGFINDIVRGIKKITGRDEAVRENVSIQPIAPNSNIQALLDRGNMSLEDKEWEKADEFFEEVLNQDAKNANAYIGKLLVENKCSTLKEYQNKLLAQYQYPKDRETLEVCEEAIDHINAQISQYKLSYYLPVVNIQKEYEFDRKIISTVSGRKLQKELQLKELKEEKILTRAKQYATDEVEQTLKEIQMELEKELDNRIKQAQEEENEKRLKKQREYDIFLKTTDDKIEKLYRQALDKKETDYQHCVTELKKDLLTDDYIRIKTCLSRMEGYQESEYYITYCEKKLKKLAGLNELYEEAEKQVKNGSIPALKKAIQIFEQLDGYGDSEEKAKECKILREQKEIKNNYDSLYDSLIKRKEVCQKRLEEKQKEYETLKESFDKQVWHYTEDYIKIFLFHILLVGGFILSYHGVNVVVSRFLTITYALVFVGCGTAEYVLIRKTMKMKMIKEIRRKMAFNKEMDTLKKDIHVLQTEMQELQNNIPLYEDYYKQHSRFAKSKK